MEYVALDVETANNTLGSICSIGLARFKDGELVDTFYSLVKIPDDMGEFNYYCVKVHGITPDVVFSAPFFKDIFGKIKSFIGNRIIVAHNAPFDSRHFRAVLLYYGLSFENNFDCTLALARRTLALNNYKLDTVCSHMGIVLDNHHNALDDAIACGRIYAKLIKK